MRIAPLLALSALALAGLAPSPARACGGTFCDNPGPGQQPMPVLQTGENVLFIVDEGHVEAHVQIQYSGSPERFAWVVPMPRAPEIKPGSQQLFANLLAGTVPTFQTSRSFAACGGGLDSSSDGVGCGSSDSAASADGAPSAGGDRANSGQGGAGGSGGVVVAKASVGAYETTTLGNGSAAEVIDWLTANSFEVPPTTAPLMKSYLEQGYVFVAIKLTAGAAVSEIHPLVFRYEGTQPCVPLKLTAVAAEENMGVRAFFLGDGRFAPLNYKHVVLNDARFDWATIVANASQSSPPPIPYEAVVAEAVDSDIAMGHAFVTDYAGPSAVVSRAGLTSAQWRSAPLATTTTPGEAVALLKSQGLLACTTSACSSPHPLVLPLLNQFIPLPVGLDSRYYNGCGDCQPTPGKPWDAKAFAAEMDERILAPGRRAEQALARYGYLTRLFTAISPAEMTADPEFVAALDDAAVAPARSATLQQQCDGSGQLTVVGAREVGPPQGGAAWPTLPAAERIEEYRPDGSVVVLKDNGPAIDEQLGQYNAAQGWPPQPEFVVDDSGCALDPGPVRGSVTARLAVALAAASLVVRRWRRRAA